MVDQSVMMMAMMKSLREIIRRGDSETLDEAESASRRRLWNQYLLLEFDSGEYITRRAASYRCFDSFVLYSAFGRNSRVIESGNASCTITMTLSREACLVTIRPKKPHRDIKQRLFIRHGIDTHISSRVSQGIVVFTKMDVPFVSSSRQPSGPTGRFSNIRSRAGELPPVLPRYPPKI